MMFMSTSMVRSLSVSYSTGISLLSQYFDLLPITNDTGPVPLAILPPTMFDQFSVTHIHLDTLL